MCTCYVRASTTTRARLYYHTCPSLHGHGSSLQPADRPIVCTYTFATKMTMLRTLRPGGSRLLGTSLRAKMYLVGPSSQGGESFFFRTHFLACEDVAGGSQQSGGNIFLKYGGPSGGSLLSGGGIIILHVIRRHFLAAAMDPAVSLSTYSTLLMEVGH